MAEVRAALVFTRSAALEEYGEFPDLHYYVLEDRNPSALRLLSDRENRLAIGDGLANLAIECDRYDHPAKRLAGPQAPRIPTLPLERVRADPEPRVERRARLLRVNRIAVESPLA